MKLIPENKQKIYYAWMSLEEAKIFAERNSITLEEEIKALNDIGFAVVDLNPINERNK